MNFFEKILIFLEYETEEAPKVFGIYHICCILICAALTTLACLFFRDKDDKTFRRLALITWIIMVVFEVYKQICYVASGVNDGKLSWSYSWYAFPYQLCSTPLYLLPFVAFGKNEKVRSAVVAFLGTFSVFGGLCNFAYPAQVYVQQVGISIQTMVHHGLQIIFGIYALVYYRKKLDYKFFLKGVIVFVIMLLIAILLNEIFYATFIEKIGHTFNMFFISRHFPCTLPILSEIYPKVPYIVFFFIYTLGFVFVAFIIYMATIGGIKLSHVIGKKK